MRWDLPPCAGIDGHLPNLARAYSESAADCELLDSKRIPGWIDAQVSVDGLDGFDDEETKLESDAWISLLEGTVHSAVVRKTRHVSQSPWLLHRFGTTPEVLAQKTHLPPSFLPSIHSLSVIFAQPPAPSSGLSSILSPSRIQVDVSGVFAECWDAAKALERPWEDRWFLRSRSVCLPFTSSYNPAGLAAYP